MKNYILFNFLLLLGFNSISQEKVSWSYGFDSGVSEIILRATIEEGWHLYSQHIDDGVGPVPTSFSFAENKAYQLVGTTKEPKPIVEFDENFEGELSYFENEATFNQKIKITNSTTISGIVTYMVCNGTMCLPPVDELFQIQIEILE